MTTLRAAIAVAIAIAASPGCARSITRAPDAAPPAADAGPPIPCLVEPSDEVCNWIDDDCDGRVDEGFEAPPAARIDADRDGWEPGVPPGPICCPPHEPRCAEIGGRLWGDCDDADPRVHPSAREVCDGRDEDCDGRIDATSAGTAC